MLQAIHICVSPHLNCGKFIKFTPINYSRTSSIYMNSRNVHIQRNFTITVASCISVIMPGDFKVVGIK